MESKDEVSDTDSGIILQSGPDSPVSPMKELTHAVHKQQRALEARLEACLEELRRLCLREAELTGTLPAEYPLKPGEKAPKVRRRIGAAYKLDDWALHRESSVPLMTAPCQMGSSWRKRNPKCQNLLQSLQPHLLGLSHPKPLRVCSQQDLRLGAQNGLQSRTAPGRKPAWTTPMRSPGSLLSPGASPAAQPPHHRMGPVPPACGFWSLPPTTWFPSVVFLASGRAAPVPQPPLRYRGGGASRSL